METNSEEINFRIGNCVIKLLSEACWVVEDNPFINALEQLGFVLVDKIEKVKNNEKFFFKLLGELISTVEISSNSF